MKLCDLKENYENFRFTLELCVRHLAQPKNCINYGKGNNYVEASDVVAGCLVSSKNSLRKTFIHL